MRRRIPRGSRMWLVALLALLAASVTGMPYTHAAGTKPVTVTITKVDALSDGLEGVGRGEADLYAGVNINGTLLDSFSVHQDDKDHIEPFWVFTQNVPDSVASVPVSIQIWDHDDCSHPFCNDTGIFESDDDKADAAPGAADEVTLTVNLSDGKWNGTQNWPNNCSQGTGDTAVRVCWDVSVQSASGDEDGDGLLDGWEKNGFDANGDGTIDVNLPAMGANPKHKDLFLELDYVTGQTPTRAGIQAMKAAFAAAPVNAGGAANPDGQRGIMLHVDTGNLIDATASEDGAAPNSCGDGIDNGGGDGVDGADPDCLAGDNLGGGNSMGALTACGLDGAYFTAKGANFNNANRRWIFRYAISANLPGSCTSTGGQGEIGGNDFIEFNHDGGTIMHEFGHTLNLRHGGFENSNCKPNYVSVMNYDNQFGINRNGGGTIFDYSPPRIAADGSTRGAAPLPQLVENGLNEATILDGTDTANQFVFVSTAGQKVRNPLNQTEDWDADGTRGDAADSSVTANIDTSGANGRPQACTNGANNSTLKGSNDWAVIALSFRQFGDSASGAINPVTEREPTTTDLHLLQQELNTADVSITKSDSADPVPAGTDLVYTLTAKNAGPNPASQVRVVDTLPSDVSYKSDDAGCAHSGSTVTCNLGELLSGSSREVKITVAVPANLVYTNGGPKTITNTATITNLAGPDPNSGNNSASETTKVIAVADLKISSFKVLSPPDQILIGQTLNVTLETVAANDGPSSPMDATLSRTASAPAGASISPTASTATVTALAKGSPQTVTEAYAIQCAQPGSHTFDFTTEIKPANAADTDPNSSNNKRTTSLKLDCVVPVAINIKPGSNPNSINLNDANVPVAVLTTKAGEYGLPLDFDAQRIDPLSVRFGQKNATFAVASKGGSEVHQRGHLEDAFERAATPDGAEKVKDGDTDMVLHFDAPQTGLTSGDTEACVKGEFVDSSGNRYRFFGCDAIRPVKP